MKIHDYNPDTHSLTVSFASDQAAESVENYPRFVFNPHNMSGNNVAEVLKTIARSGKTIAEAQDLKEQSVANTELTTAYRLLANQTFTYSVTDLFPQSTPTMLVDSLTDVTNS